MSPSSLLRRFRNNIQVLTSGRTERAKFKAVAHTLAGTGCGLVCGGTSQFNDAASRAHGGQAKVKGRLIADLDPDEWDLPPKPKWMRWATYNRHVARYDHYEDILDYGCVALAAKFLGK